MIDILLQTDKLLYDEKAILELRRQDWSYNRIIAVYSVSAGTLKKLFDKHGLGNVRAGNPNGLKIHQRIKIINMHQMGIDKEDIGRRFNRSVETIYRILQEGPEPPKTVKPVNKSAATAARVKADLMVEFNTLCPRCEITGTWRSKTYKGTTPVRRYCKSCRNIVNNRY